MQKIHCLRRVVTNVFSPFYTIELIAASTEEFVITKVRVKRGVIGKDLNCLITRLA